MATFEYAQTVGTVEKLLDKARARLSNSPDQEIRKLVAQVPPEGDWLEQPVAVAFVGQYDAGKSMILRALTGLDTIPVSSDIETDQVAAFDWQGLHVLDTPGLDAGRPEHDARTSEAIDAADLLVFVITNELFDGRMRRHFRELAFDRAKLPEMMLVVNKMAQDTGSPEDKLADLALDLDPATPGELRATCIDAESLVAARDAADAQDRQDLTSLSNFDAFVDALNGFVADRRLMGRLTTPLYQLLTAAEAARRLAATDDPLERAALELLRRKKVLTLENRQRLRSTLTAQIQSAVADLVACGDLVAERVEPGVGESEMDSAYRSADQKFNGRANELREECVRLASEAEIALEKEFEELGRSILAEQIRELARRASSTYLGFNSAVGKAPGEGPKVDTETDAFKRSKKAGEVAQKIGTLAATKAFGEASGQLGKASAAAGGELHKAVYAAGKFFGVNFRPWGAANITKVLGNVGKVLGVLGPLLGAVGQVLEDEQQAKLARQLREARDHIRMDFGGAAAAVERAFFDEFEEFSAKLYDTELREADNQIDRLTVGRNLRSAASRGYEAIASECRQLIAFIQRSA